ncbi:GbsR/MarR family transcriptional regulator [Sporosarcina koreensis]|uniref:GbsR/MarR family transcriptional regulator n=1 Tax=Sporosarcina koreensis TaxID=334735 RepID=UPI0005917EA0|nr:transcriptional regulator [Sporosarcina koreensis]
MDAEERLEKSRKRVTESIAQNIHLYGLPPSAGRQFGMMFFEDRPLTLDDMSAKLGMSKTSMSTSIRALSDGKLVERVWEKGVRKDLYKAKEDWYQIFIDMFTVQWRRAVSLHISAVRKSLRELKELKNEEGLTEELLAEVENDMEKLTYTLAYYDWLDRLIDAFEDHKIFDLVPIEENEK